MAREFKMKHTIRIINEFHNVDVSSSFFGLFDNEKYKRLVKKYACSQKDCRCETRVKTDDYVIGHLCDWNSILEEWKEVGI
jgi:hypothetical protein